MTLKLGRLPRTYRPMLHWSALRHAATIAAPPNVVNWSAGMPADLGMLGNGPDPHNPPQESGGLGDCVCALVGHATQVWSFNATPPMATVTTAETIALYERECGFVPSNPGSDQGCIEQTVFNDWFTKGTPAAGRLLLPPIEIDVRNLGDIREAIYECGLVGIGFNVPAYIMDGSMTWAPDPSGDQTIVGGHGVVLAGYNKAHKYFDVISWGSPGYKMKVGFFNSFVDEAYAFIHPLWIARTGKTPLGLTVAQLEALAASL